jgi:hypothetical protein
MKFNVIIYENNSFEEVLLFGLFVPFGLFGLLW